MEKTDIKVIFEDGDILVLDKPYGLIVNRSNTAKSGTLQDWIDTKLGFNSTSLDTEKDDAPDENSEEYRDDFIGRSGIVHRLDKDTSGILVIAKNELSFNNLLSQFKERKSVKEYTAVLCGKIDDDIVEINAPIRRNPKIPLKFAVVEGGKEAFTRFEKIKVIEKDREPYSILKILPKTGRTHQIRVHSSAMGHPVAGDSIYCSNVLLEKSLKAFGRMMLHSSKLGLYHPKSGNYMEFTSQLPKEFPL